MDPVDKTGIAWTSGVTPMQLLNEYAQAKGIPPEKHQKLLAGVIEMGKRNLVMDSDPNGFFKTEQFRVSQDTLNQPLQAGQWFHIPDVSDVPVAVQPLETRQVKALDVKRVAPDISALVAKSPMGEATPSAPTQRVTLAAAELEMKAQSPTLPGDAAQLSAPAVGIQLTGIATIAPKKPNGHATDVLGIVSHQSKVVADPAGGAGTSVGISALTFIASQSRNLPLGVKLGGMVYAEAANVKVQTGNDPASNGVFGDAGVMVTADKSFKIGDSGKSSIGVRLREQVEADFNTPTGFRRDIGVVKLNTKVADKPVTVYAQGVLQTPIFRTDDNSPKWSAGIGVSTSIASGVEAKLGYNWHGGQGTINNVFAAPNTAVPGLHGGITIQIPTKKSD